MQTVAKQPSISVAHGQLTVKSNHLNHRYNTARPPNGLNRSVKIMKEPLKNYITFEFALTLAALHGLGKGPFHIYRTIRLE